MMTVLTDLYAGLTLLTRLPVGWWPHESKRFDLARSIWVWPLVGGLTGALVAGIFLGMTAIGAPSTVAAVWAIGGQVLLTGALHEDGFADTADGFFGGRTKERRLEIMRDSRIGVYGVVALGILLLLRLQVLPRFEMSATRMVPVLVAVGALSRAAMLMPLLLLKPARPDGLARDLRSLPPVSLVMACFLAVAAVLPLPPLAGVIFLGVALFSGLLVSWTARRKIDGYSGDVLGATAIVAETLMLTVATF